MTSATTLADPETGTIDDIVDLDRYPIHEPDPPAWMSAVEHVRSSLADEGLVTLPGFLRPAALRRTADELAAIVPHVTLREQRNGVYHRDFEASVDRSDPRCTALRWYAGHVTRDMIPPYALAHRLYVSAWFKRFVASCVGLDRVFEYADPIAGLVATILPPGGQYPWHYDTNEFVLTIVTQQPDHGGTFEYVKDLRTPGDENLEGLGRVLGGDRRQVRSVGAAPGDLQLFLGRYSLHQVTPVTGDRQRHTLVLSYAERPGVIGPIDRTRSVYGRVTEAHLVAGGVDAADGLIL